MATIKATGGSPEEIRERVEQINEEEQAKEQAAKAEAEIRRREYLNDPDRALEVVERGRQLREMPEKFRQDAFVQVVARVPVKEGASVQDALTGNRDEEDRLVIRSFTLGVLCMGIAVLLYALVKGGVL